MLAAGDKIGRYRILSRLRAGGMATLYLGARDGAAGFARPVAIKMIHPHLASDTRFAEMFIDEARLASKIDDPHVVRTEELGEESGRYFLVMEYVHGCSLADLLRELGKRRLAATPEIATWIAIQVAAGLHAAHEATREDGSPLGIVHRDVSPQNVLLAFKGHVKLIDFGIAKARGKIAVTKETSIQGKLAYMAPEQAYGRAVDRRADVYALGIVLWELLTMQRLFEADNDFALLDRVREAKVRPPSEIVPDLAPALDRAVMAALAKDPADRPQTAEALRALLARAEPRALEVSPGDVAALLASIMGKQLADARRRVAGVLGEGLRDEEPTPALPQRMALESMTIARPEAAIFFDESEAPEPPTAVQPSHPAAPATASRSATRRGRIVAFVVGFGVVFSLAYAGVFRPAESLPPRREPRSPAAENAPAASAAEPSAAADPPAASALSPAPEADAAAIASATGAAPGSRHARPPSRRPLRVYSAPSRIPAASAAPSSRVIIVDGVPIAEKL